MIMDMTWVVVLSVYGLMFGSFINAFVWRYHQTHDDEGKLKKLSKKQKQLLSITRGRSICTDCKHQLSYLDLVPLFSWLFLGGKCRYCHKPISIQYPLVELATAILFVLSYVFWPLGFQTIGIVMFLVWVVIVGFFVLLAVYDIKWQLLPDKILIPFTAVTVVYGVLSVINAESTTGGILGILGGILACSGLFALLFVLSNGRWIGGGDVKIGIGLGILAGSLLSGILVIMFASVIGLIISVPFLFSKKLEMKSKIAFGPMLIMACYIVVIFGQQMIDWYLDFLQI